MARTKGALGQATQETKEFREKFRNYCLLSGGFKKFLDELGELKGANYVNYFLKALEFSEPKLSRMVNKDGDDVEPVSLTVKITDERG